MTLAGWQSHSSEDGSSSSHWYTQSPGSEPRSRIFINDTGFALSASNAEFMFFVVLGTFVAFMISAVAFIALTFLRALIGQFGPRKADSVAAAAFYWNTVVAMYAIAWYVIYVTK